MEKIEGELKEYMIKLTCQSCPGNPTLSCNFQAEFKTATGSDWQPAGGAAPKQEKQKKAAKDAKPKEKVETSNE